MAHPWPSVPKKKRGSKRQAFGAGKGDADEQQQETSVGFGEGRFGETNTSPVTTTVYLFAGMDFWVGFWY